jgi:hypothetical protein
MMMCGVVLKTPIMFKNAIKALIILIFVIASEAWQSSKNGGSSLRNRHSRFFR